MSKKILVIDDEEILTKTFSKLLQKSGYEVLVSKSGVDAVEMTEEEDFDLVISDIRMPGMNGVEAIERMIRVLKNQNRNIPPVIFISGYADKNVEEKLNALEPIGYLKKPFDNFELLKKVESILK